MDATFPSSAIDQLGELVRDERAALLAAATREGLNPEEGLECVQDALCTWLARSTTEPAHDRSALAASIKVTVRNAARNFRRRHRRLKPHRAIDDDVELAAARPEAERVHTHTQASQRLRSCVAELREVERAVITLRLLEERSGEDVARALGLARGHVDVLVHRAKLTLRACMGAASCHEP